MFLFYFQNGEYIACRNSSPVIELNGGQYSSINNNSQQPIYMSQSQLPSEIKHEPHYRYRLLLQPFILYYL